MRIGVAKNIRRTTLISIFLSSLLVGLFVARFTLPINGAWLAVPMVLLPFITRRSIVLASYLILTGFLLGWWRGGLLQTENIRYRDYYYNTVQISVRATEDAFYADNGQLQFSAEDIKIDNTDLPGKIQIRGFGASMVYKHDIVSVKGKMYPALGGRQANISYATLEVLGRTNSFMDNIRRRFIAGMETALPEPAASLGVGLLVGQRSLLPDNVQESLKVAGLTHIVAVSGYNLTIIVEAVRRGLKRLSRFQILATSLSLIYSFLLITGYSPSIIRASLISLLSLLAWYFGRKFQPILLLLLVASITAFVNPYYVWGDIGWYLSYLAFFGVLMLAPLLTTRLFGQLKVNIIGSVAIESFSAQIMTMPLIMFIFGQISIIGLLANVIIVPMIPFAMLFSFIAGLAGAILPIFSGWFALPGRAILDVMIWLIAWFSKWPASIMQIKLSSYAMIELYAIAGLFIIGLKKYASSVRIVRSE